MPNEELKRVSRDSEAVLREYIQESRKSGKTDSQIREELLRVGWGEEEVSDGLSVRKKQSLFAISHNNYKIALTLGLVIFIPLLIILKIPWPWYTLKCLAQYSQGLQILIIVLLLPFVLIARRKKHKTLSRLLLYSALIIAVLFIANFSWVNNINCSFL